ncbi:MAG: hypothetical protein C0501_13390 [Isosphaera sp.]|nr:hypothetical protein [Isosphaera sp.]
MAERGAGPGVRDGGGGGRGAAGRRPGQGAAGPGEGLAEGEARGRPGGAAGRPADDREGRVPGGPRGPEGGGRPGVPVELGAGVLPDVRAAGGRDEGVPRVPGGGERRGRPAGRVREAGRAGVAGVRGGVAQVPARPPAGRDRGEVNHLERGRPGRRHPIHAAPRELRSLPNGIPAAGTAAVQDKGGPPVSRLSFAVLAALLPAAAPAADPPKEPVHDGKPLAEWVKQIGAEDADASRRAVDAVRALAGRTDEVAHALVAAAAGSKKVNTTLLRVLVDLGPKAVPALTAGLWSGDEDAKRTRLIVLAQIGADARPAVPAVVRLLTAPDAKVRASAAGALGRIEGYSAVPALTKALADESLDVRLAAAGALVRLDAGTKDVPPVLTAVLKTGDQAARDSAALFLATLGPDAAPAVPDLVALLPEAAAEVVPVVGAVGPAAKDAVPALKKLIAGEKTDGAVRPAAAAALWLVGRDPEAARVLRGMLAGKDAPPVVWRSVGHFLARIDPGPETDAALERGLKSEDPGVAVVAARLLGARSKDAVPRLAALLAHKDARVRARAVIALAELGPAAAGAADALRAAAKDDEPETAFWAAVAACRLDPKPEAVAAVAARLDHPYPGRRLEAAAILAQLGAAGKPAVPNLTALLDDREHGVRLRAATALWKIDGSAAALPAAAGLLKDPDPLIRELAAADLGIEFGPDAKAAVPDLVRSLFDPFAAVRWSAAEALGRVGPGAADAVGPLLALLDGDEPGPVQSAACEAVGLIGPADREAAAGVLRRKLDHPDALVRAHAALALVLVAEDKAGEKEAARGLSHRSYRVRITSAETLWRTAKDERVVPLLVRTLEDANLDGTWGDNERYMAVRALGRVGPAAKAAVPELVKLLAHPDAQLAATAAAALKAVDPAAAKKAGVR